eukprot:jgi/Tetstr1/426419/TSEL_016727.t1
MMACNYKYESTAGICATYVRKYASIAPSLHAKWPTSAINCRLCYAFQVASDFRPEWLENKVVALPLAGTAASPELNATLRVLKQHQKKAGGSIKHNTNAVKNLAATQASLPRRQRQRGQ